MTGQDVGFVIDKLADKLAMPAGKLMELLPMIGVRYMWEAAGMLLFALAMWVVAVGFWRAGNRKKGPRDEEICVPLYFISVCVAVFAIFATAGGVKMASSAALLYNPQAWALQYVLDKF